GQLDALPRALRPYARAPPPGRGGLAAKCRDTDPGLVDLLAAVDDPASRAAATAERAVLAELQAGCHAPVGAYAVATDTLRLTAVVIPDDGASPLSAGGAAPVGAAARIGREGARELVRRGAGRDATGAAGHTGEGV